MIESSVIIAVQRLLAEQHVSQRQISRRLGVSRGMVARIARQKRRVNDPLASLDDATRKGPTRLCPSCGVYVYSPCRLCRVREQLRRKSYPRRPDSQDTEIHLELRPHHRERYEQVRAMRQRARKRTTQDSHNAQHSRILQETTS